MKLFTNFFADEDGAVTVDWVVLTAAIVGLGIAVLSTVAGGSGDLATSISSYLTDGSITVGDDPAGN
jgi:Flp pilus assembly pilin Flp